ncbi:GNAT family N-acetyltransferase [Pseudomonas entomophila]|uniref:GNAT family N-acetyltransferase n=1 Tax=Pseudomonas entomophila TaxID=312306 RepID=UPI001EFFB8C7|nr:GNAT family N-acetyltransferase [Pseudomonas entomophila]MCG8291330.1 hypothetical protein [Pseudomonas entomophila]
MTSTNVLHKSVSTPVDIETRTDAFDYRPGHINDIPRLAQLFQSVYGQTTHPCQSPAYIRSSMDSGQQQWFVAELDSFLVGCCCVARRPWNQSWEMSHGVVHPAARRTGAISNLVRLGLERHRPHAMELGFYVTRNIASHALMKKIRPGVLVGHDGGPDKVDGIREYHLTALLPPAQEGFVHVAPGYAHNGVAGPIIARLYDALRLTPPLGTYPATCLSGPPGAEVHGPLRFNHEPGADALMVSGHVGDNPTQPATLQAITALLQRHPQVQYFSVHILADKLELLAGLVSLGFAITAYLPAWHLEGGVRYDCILLVFEVFADAPRSHGFDDEVAFFDQVYAKLTDSLCGIALQ